MDKKLSIIDAIKVASKDTNGGVCFAIEKLEALGFNCDSYYKSIDAHSEAELFEDFDTINLQARDNLYKELGIADLMRDAYEIVEEFGIDSDNDY